MFAPRTPHDAPCARMSETRAGVLRLSENEGHVGAEEDGDYVAYFHRGVG